MKDRLEDFIKSHRTDFDDLEPRTDTWSKIQKELEQENKGNDLTWLWKAAAVIFLCVSVGLAIERTMESETEVLADVQDSVLNRSSELLEVEGYYTQLIAQKQIEIKSVIDKKGLVDVELLQDMEQLDEMYVKLKQDLKSNQNDERLINAMIQNLQLRVEILNKQLRILERISKHEEDEKISV